MADDDFWREDAEAIAQRERERQTGLRMPQAAKAGNLPAPAVTQRAVSPEAGNNQQTIPSWLLKVFLIGLIALFALQWHRLSKQSERRAADVALLESQFCTASDADQRRVAKTIRELTEAGIILKILQGSDRAEVYVMPAFYLLDVDQKSHVIRACYLSAFRLPLSTQRFPWPMAVLDGTTGKRIRTFDLASLGLNW